MDGVGAVVKRAIDDVVGFNPDISFKNTEDVLKFLPALTVGIYSYNQNDVETWKAKLPSSIKVKTGKGKFGLGSAHEVLVIPDSGDWQLKRTSADSVYVKVFVTCK